MKNLEKNWLEWIIFGLGLILVASTIGFLIYDAATVSETPPSIELRLGEPQQQYLTSQYTSAGKQLSAERSPTFIVPVSVSNKGQQTAEAVLIEVVLESGGKEKERAEFEIAFLPRGATQEGWVTFQTDPRTAERIKTRAVGYQKP